MSDTFDIEAERLRLETLGYSFHVEDFQFSGVTLYRVRILFKGEEIDETRSRNPEMATQKALERAKEHKLKRPFERRIQANAGWIKSWIVVIPILIGTIILIVAGSVLATDQFSNHLQTLAQVEIISFEELGSSQSDALSLFYQEESIILFIGVSLILVGAIWVIDKILINNVPTFVNIGTGAVTGFIIGGFIYYVPFFSLWFSDKELAINGNIQAAFVFAALGSLVGALLAVFYAATRDKDIGIIPWIVMIVSIFIAFSFTYLVWYSTAFGYSGWEVAFNIPKALGGLLQALLGISAILFLIAIPYFIFSMYIRIPRKFYNQVMDGTIDLTIIALLATWLISIIPLFFLCRIAYLYWDISVPANTPMQPLLIIAFLLVGSVLLISYSQCPNCRRFLKKEKISEDEDYDYYQCRNCSYKWKDEKPTYPD